MVSTWSLATVNRNLIADLEKVVLTVKPDKYQAYIQGYHHKDNAEKIREGIPPGGYFDSNADGKAYHSRSTYVDGEKALGLTVGNVLIGTEDYVKIYLES